MAELKIYEANLDKFIKRVKKLRAKAEKLDTMLPDWKTLEIGSDPIREPERDPATGFLLEDPRNIPRAPWRRVEIWGVEDVRVEGFRFLAKVEPSPVEGVNFIHAVPGVDSDDLADFRRSDLRCDHCQTRRQRKSTFVIEDIDSGQRFISGRNCLADFIGSPNAEGLAHFTRDIDELLKDESWGRFSGGEMVLSLESFVEMTGAIIERYGWKSAGVAYDTDDYPTKSLVLDALFGDGIFKDQGRYVADPIPEIKEEHRADAKAAIEWVRSLSTDPSILRNGYLLNLRLVCEGDHFPIKKAGLVASLLGAHRRGLAKEAREAEIEAEKEAASPVPEKEGRIEVEGEIVAASWKCHDFGETLKITVKHEDGWKVWGSAPKVFGRDESELVGKIVSFTAKVSRSQDDNTFGFFSRPTKAEITESV